MTNKERYERDINHSDDYRITVKAFRDWLTAKNMTEVFNTKLRDRGLTVYDIACDFSIPVSMVKLFRRTA